MILALLLMMSGVDDPRTDLIRLQLAGETQTALDEVERALATRPEATDDWGLSYLRGHLLERLDHPQAAEAFATSLGTTPELAAYGRYRLALSQLRLGHPEVAAGLLASLLANDPPSSLVPTAVRLLSESLSQGGDCRLLRTVDDWRIDSDDNRPIRISKARCALLAGEPELATELATALLQQSREDEPARSAALLLADLPLTSASAAQLLRIGLTFHQHREFERAIPLLERAVSATTGSDTGLRGVDRADALYELARSRFWLEDYAAAADTFEQVANEETSAGKRARAYFQQGRCRELETRWSEAVASYRRAFEITPTSSWTPAALLSALRVEWRQGNERAALELLSRLRSNGNWRSLARRGLIFIAASDIVNERTERAADWLRLASQSASPEDLEVAFWKGRLAELRADDEIAIRHYADVLAQDAYHPLAMAARGRLSRAELRTPLDRVGQNLASSERSSDWLRAWLLLGTEESSGAGAHRRLRAHWQSQTKAKPFMTFEVVAPAAWTIWQETADRPEVLLMRLGIVEQMSPMVRRHFPAADTAYALTGSVLLSSSGLHRPSLYLAEVAAKRIPAALPDPFLSPSLRRLLYPRPYQSLVRREARRHRVDPDLLTAIIREESRFDPMAVSAASARGLTQFVLPTARRMASTLGWRRIDALDLHRPEVAIALGAAYLATLERDFSGRDEAVIAAYNAGENQARLWASYCYGDQPEEYFSKVGFTQTRNYLRKVGSSREHYREIYADGADHSVE